MRARETDGLEAQEAAQIPQMPFATFKLLSLCGKPLPKERVGDKASETTHTPSGWETTMANPTVPNFLITNILKRLEISG
jgi:hypothetical protein